jgi:hypothetical protein
MVSITFSLTDSSPWQSEQFLMTTIVADDTGGYPRCDKMGVVRLIAIGLSPVEQFLKAFRPQAGPKAAQGREVRRQMLYAQAQKHTSANMPARNWNLSLDFNKSLLCAFLPSFQVT